MTVVPLVLYDSETGEQMVIGKAFVDEEMGDVEVEFETSVSSLLVEDIKMSIGPFTVKDDSLEE